MSSYEGLKEEEIRYLIGVHQDEGYFNGLGELRQELQKLHTEVDKI